jgi:hypothetical protein
MKKIFTMLIVLFLLIGFFAKPAQAKVLSACSSSVVTQIYDAEGLLFVSVYNGSGSTLHFTQWRSSWMVFSPTLLDNYYIASDAGYYDYVVGPFTSPSTYTPGSVWTIGNQKSVSVQLNFNKAFVGRLLGSFTFSECTASFNGTVP